MKKTSLRKGFEVVRRIRTGEEPERISPGTRTNKPTKYASLLTKLELEEKELAKAEKEAEKAKKEARKKIDEIRRKAEREKNEEMALMETARKNEERFAAMRARNDEANSKSRNKSAKPNRPRSKPEPWNESSKKATRGKASKGEVPAKKNGVKSKKMSQQRGRTPMRTLAPIVETASSESSFVENGMRSRSAYRKKKSEVSKSDEPKSKKKPVSRSPEWANFRSIQSDVPKSKKKPVSPRPHGYTPLAERMYIPLGERIGSLSRSRGRFSRGFSPTRADDESSNYSSDSDEDDVRDESESPRRVRRGRGSRHTVKWDDRTFESDDRTFDCYDSVGGDTHDDFTFIPHSHFDHVPPRAPSIFDNVLDSTARVVERLVGPIEVDESTAVSSHWMGGETVMGEKTVSSYTYVSGLAM